MPGFGGTRAILGVAMTMGIAGCSATDFIPLCQVPDSATAAERAAAVAACSAMGNRRILDTRVHRDVDILFVIDNSPTMAPKQKALARAFGKIVAELEASRVNYHLGVVTTDVGTYTAPDTPFPGAPPSACSSYAGDDGVLQNIPCTNRTGLVGEAAQACAASCPDPRFVPAHGMRYIAKTDGLTNVPQLLVDGIDVGPQRAFQCLSLVGASGCQVTQPLEAARRALDRSRPENAGFNRDSSVLAVVFITDQDDCSVPLGQRRLLDPATPNAGQPECERGSQSVDGQCLNTGFRCLAKNVVCAEPLNTPGAKSRCRESPSSFLEPIDKYVDFFANLPNPNLILVGIWSPTLLDNLDALPQPILGGLMVDYDPSAPRNSAALTLGTQGAAACYNPDPSLTTDPRGYFGQAQLRLSSFIRHFQKSNSLEVSICQPDRYASALDYIPANDWGSLDCLSAAPKIVEGVPKCLVGYVDANNQYGTPDVALPVCGATCCNFFATDTRPGALSETWVDNPHRIAGLAACGGEPADCFCAVKSSENCGSYGAVAGVWRKGNAAPPGGKVVSFSCAN